MPSANRRRNRRMRKAQAAQAQAIQKADQPDFRSVAVADAVNHSITKTTDLVSHNSSRDNCSLCNGNRCESVFKVGYCGCKFGYYCFEAIYMKECPTCPSKESQNSNNPIDTFSRNVAGGMVEVGEFASLALEDWANSVTNFVTSPIYDGPVVNQRANLFDSRPQSMNQRERDDVIRNVKIAKAVVGTAATLTGHLANGVGTCLWALGSVLSPVVREVSTKILTANNVDKERAERMVDGGMEIAKAAIISTGSVARGAQMGTGILASGVGRRLARNYERSCGFQPGELESHVGDIAQNAVHTAWNVRAIQPKSKLTKISRINPAPKSGK
ncbi:uncharacterized protein LOC119072269 [Bradysia coprophila]|uniref:uncharacterized protein LOC119072269 n=1 Tax=Bradysia coprophila TaxID=38358 RepID=UPI00187DBAA2|nr:uncharacterized protein LOC119072269 [Bradysia coprophila]